MGWPKNHKMTTLARIIIGLILSLFVSSCAFDMGFNPGKKGNGNVEEEKREVTSEFSEVSAAEGIDVYLTQGDEFEIVVEADENVLDLIATDINDNRLRVHTVENIGRATKKVYITLPAVTLLRTSSGAEITSKNTLNASNIELSASSGSEINLDLNAREVDADTSSGADIKLRGSAQTLYADASSGSDIRAKDFKVSNCVADASSGADISVWVEDNLTAEASSGADISYGGDPSVKKKKSVSGSVHKY